MNIHSILQRPPHCYPFFLVDWVLKYEVGKNIHDVKNITINEPFFAGHFPSYPIMPGVLILEALAQAAGILSLLTINATLSSNEIIYFVGIDGARFKIPATAGDQLHLYVDIERRMQGIWKFKTKAACIDGKVALKRYLMCAKPSE